MVSIIVFSFNRAMQLDALIHSIIEYWDVTKIKIVVIYNTTNDFYEQGYKLLQENIKEKKYIHLLKETEYKREYNFKELLSLFNLKHYIKYSYVRSPKSNFRELLATCIKECSEHIIFLTDDSVFIDNVIVSDEILNEIDQRPFQSSFSLRLGKEMNNPPKNIDIDDSYIKWNYYLQPKLHNWGYQFSVDGHIYSKKIILELFENIVFSNPSSLEMFCCEYVRLKKWLKNGISFVEPKLLSFPLNMVQNIQKNESSGVEPEILNYKYLEGNVLKYEFSVKINTFQQYPDCLSYYKDGRTERCIITEKSDRLLS